MIPDDNQCRKLWDKYNLPPEKRRHCELVAQVARKIAAESRIKNQASSINMQLLIAAALLHDLDKNIPKLPGERHPDAAVRTLEEEGMSEVAVVVQTHPLHAIIDANSVPQTVEQKILYLSDKMVKYELIGVDERFRLWREEDLAPEAQAVLHASYPKVKKLEQELLSPAGIDFGKN